MLILHVAIAIQKNHFMVFKRTHTHTFHIWNICNTWHIWQKSSQTKQNKTKRSELNQTPLHLLSIIFFWNNFFSPNFRSKIRESFNFFSGENMPKSTKSTEKNGEKCSKRRFKSSRLPKLEKNSYSLSLNYLLSLQLQQPIRHHQEDNLHPKTRKRTLWRFR